jgi:hypothetical protein
VLFGSFSRRRLGWRSPRSFLRAFTARTAQGFAPELTGAFEAIPVVAGGKPIISRLVFTTFFWLLHSRCSPATATGHEAIKSLSVGLQDVAPRLLCAVLSIIWRGREFPLSYRVLSFLSRTSKADAETSPSNVKDTRIYSDAEVYVEPAAPIRHGREVKQGSLL